MAILYGDIDKDTKREKIHYNRGDMVASQTINDIQDTAIDAHNMATEALDKADSLFQGNGTVVSVGGREVGTLAFSSDPQQQIDTLSAKIGTASSFNAEIVDELPTENISTSTFYLVPNSTSADDNTYSEYLYVNGKWELLGNTQVQAYDDSELRTLINNLSTSKANKSDIPTKLPTPNKLTIKVTDQTPKYFDGSEAVEVNIDLPNVDGLVDIVNEHSESLNEINTELAGKADKSEIPSISGLASESYVNTQVSALQGKIDGKQDTISDLATIRSGASAGATAVQPSALDDYYTESEVNTLLSGKVDKVTGKGLSTNDYTTAEKNKLAGLSNYDDTAIKNSIAGKVDKTTTINSKPLSSNITLSASDVGALPNTTAIPKLYNDIGENTDGAIDQATMTTFLTNLDDGMTMIYNGASSKYAKPSTGIPKTDLASNVQTSLGKADTALQSIPAEYITETELTAKGYATTTDVSGKLDKVTNSTTPQVYGVDALGSQTMYELSNTVRNGGLVSRFGEQILVPITPTQDQSATSKSYVDKVDGEIYSHINSEVQRVEGLIANAGGTTVTVGSTPVTSLKFDSNPQTQITNLETSLYNTKVILESNVSTNASDIDKLETSVTNLQNNKADKSEIPDISNLATKNEIPDVTGIANPNILINGDFRINQRGSITYSGNKIYGVDRWIMRSCVVDVLNSGIKVTQTAQWFGINQSLEDFNHLKGKTLTLSVKFSSVNVPNDWLYIAITNGGSAETRGTILESLGNITQAGVYTITTTIADTLSNNYFNVCIQNGNGVTTTTNNFTVEYVKLEVGNIATSFNPRPYAEELLLCQRYYEKIDVSVAANKFNILKTARTANEFYEPCVNFKVTKRTRPTVHCYSSNNTIDTLTNISNSTDQSVRYTYITNDSFRVSGNSASFTTNGNVTGYFEADAEIY